MPDLTAEQFERVEALFFEAGGLPPEQRDGFLDSACDDVAVREEVRGMLAHSGAGGGDAGGTVLDDALAALVAAPASPGAADALLRRLIGTRVAAYEFTDILGRGGMGVVYLARDVRLGRTVAIKALPPGLSRHPLRMSRFVREAKVLASLSHPNIATVFGLEESAGMKFLVMERVEGETLARRLARGALPVREALEVTRDIACGVEIAHAAGVVHRDLKPGNVMIQPDGRAKVLDFGLAREVGRSPDAAETFLAGGSGAPSTADALTSVGSVVGTPGYSSPEQLRGKPVDRRTDVFALGCILYECLTGRVAFPGGSGADVIAGILHREPDPTLLPANTPAPVRRLLARCLAKDADDRMRDMGDVRLELDEALAAAEWLAPPAPGDRGAPAARRWPPLALALVLASALVAAAATVVTLRRAPTPAPPSPLRRFAMLFPSGAPQSDLPRVRLSLSRDGTRVAVAASDATGHHLWVRDRADTDFRKVEGTEGAAAPALSPDGSWLAYLADGAVWKRRVAGGNRVKLADLAGDWAACHWDADGQITLSPARLGGLARVPEEGGAAHFVTAPRPERGEFATIAGCAVPDGSALLLAVRDGNPEPRIEALHLASGRRQTVVERGSTPRLSATPAGTCLLWERAGTVYAAPFDAASLKVTGREVAVADGVLVDRAALHAYYDVADDGTLAYVPGAAFTEDSHLSWLDPDDLEAPPEPLGEERESFAEPRFTADGKYLSVVLKGDPYRAYVFDLARHTLLRVNTSGDCTSAAISPGGLRLAYAVGRDGRYAVLVKHLSDHSEEVLADAGGACPGELHWSADGKWLTYSLTQVGSMRRDVWVVDVESKKAEPFCASADADERCPRFSPAGNWIAYASDESGRRDVYIRSFPGGKVVRMVSTGGGGGGEPEWSADGRKLYYRGSAGLYLAPITANWADGSLPALVCRANFGQADSGLSDYAVAPDGRLLVVEPSQRGPTAPQATLVLNWHQLLKPAR